MDGRTDHNSGVLRACGEVSPRSAQQTSPRCTGCSGTGNGTISSMATARPPIAASVSRRTYCPCNRLGGTSHARSPLRGYRERDVVLSWCAAACLTCRDSSFRPPIKVRMAIAEKVMPPSPKRARYHHTQPRPGATTFPIMIGAPRRTAKRPRASHDHSEVRRPSRLYGRTTHATRTARSRSGARCRFPRRVTISIDPLSRSDCLSSCLEAWPACWWFGERSAHVGLGRIGTGRSSRRAAGLPAPDPPVTRTMVAEVGCSQPTESRTTPSCVRGGPSAHSHPPHS
ncbi:hypothetical protein SNOUR_34760 [Streptomyces noursei ATCC 11455]|nr:hypothetical protein SNOUR_34760 [Streptomyces noursei ATCC 11455]